jgi:hypothetical protein
MGRLADRLAAIENSIGGEIARLRAEPSISTAVEEDAIINFSIALMDIEEGAVASADIDITSIAASLQKSTGGGAFSAAGITQPTFSKATGLVSCDYRFLEAEWEIGDIYKLSVSGITADLGDDTGYVRPMIWSNMVLEEANVEAKIDVIDGFMDVPLADAADNTQMRDVIGSKTDTVAGNSMVSAMLKAAEVYKNGRGVWYCDSSVGASGDGGLWSRAFKTITEAVTAASAGDVIYIRGEFSSVAEGATITLDKELWLIGENTTSNQGCTMIYNGGAAAYPLVTIAAHQCKIFNIYFSQIATQDSIVLGGFWKTHIKGCRFDEAKVMISVSSVADDPDTTIEDCFFRSWTDYAIDITCTRALIKNCRFIDVALASTAIRNTSNGGDRPDTAILDCRFHTYDVANGVAIEVTNTPTAGLFYIDGCHFSYFADDNHAVSKRTGYCGLNYRDVTVLAVT